MGAYEKLALFDDTRELFAREFSCAEIVIGDKNTASLIGGRVQSDPSRPPVYSFVGHTHARPTTYLYGLIAPSTGFLGYLSIVDAAALAETAGEDSGKPFQLFRRNIAGTVYDGEISRSIARATQLSSPQAAPLSPFYVDPAVIREEFFSDWKTPQSVTTAEKLGVLQQFDRLIHGQDD